MQDLSPEARAARRRFLRSATPTPRQMGDAAFARLAEAEELNELADPYDHTLVELATDPSVVRFAKAKRVHAGQTARRLKRRLNANRHRRSD